MVGFFLDLIKEPSLQLTLEEYVIRLSVLKLCLREDLKINTFRIRLVDMSCLSFFKYLTPQIN